MFVIILNKDNLVGSDNNTMVYNFPSSATFNDESIAVSNISMFYSWFNISSNLGNNILTYTWTVGTTTTVYTITIDDGLYEINDLNSLFHYAMVNNGTYLIDNSGKFVYYFNLEVNANRYAIQLDTYPVPTSLPSGYTEPVGFKGYATQGYNPIVSFPNSFNSIVGYVPSSGIFSSNENLNNSYIPPAPSSSTFYAQKTTSGKLSYLSNVSPNVQPNSCLYISISGIDNKYSNPSSIIYSIVPTVKLGQQIVEKPPNLIWNKLITGTYSSIRVQILGTNLQPIKLNDPSITIILALKDKNELH